MQCSCSLTDDDSSLYKNREKFTANHIKSINRSNRQWTRKWWNINASTTDLFCHSHLTMERANAFTRIKAIYSHGLCQNALPQCTDLRFLPVLSQNASFSRLFSLLFFSVVVENVHAHIAGYKHIQFVWGVAPKIHPNTAISSNCQSIECIVFIEYIFILYISIRYDHFYTPEKWA